MNIRRASLLLVVLARSNALAAPPAVSILSTGPLSVNGTLFYAPGVFSWPLFPGDDVATQDDAAVILFPDQSRIRLARHTRLRLEQHETGLRIRLLFGALRLSLPEAMERNVGTWDSDANGEATSGRTTRARVRKRTDHTPTN